MDLITSLMTCLGYHKSTYSSTDYLNLNEKVYRDTDPDLDIAALTFVDTLLKADNNDKKLRSGLETSVSVYGWTESIAEAILNRLIQALENRATLGQVVKDALEKVYEAAKDFVHNHPYYTAFIALGILAALTPWVLTALGFGELGIVEGSLAALWQSRFAGLVPKGSLFSFLQRCGMILHWST